jgi:hypothetical protein
LAVEPKDCELSDQVVKHDGSFGTTEKLVDVAAALATRTVLVDGTLDTTEQLFCTFTVQVQVAVS